MCLHITISIIGWLKSEKFPKIASYFIIVLMICLVGFQIYESHLLASDLRQKEQHITLSEKRANQAERGIIDVYDFYGRHRMNSPGKISTDSATKEVTAFQKMVQLQNEKKDKALIKLCQQQIQQNPEWLTSYLFLGAAYMNIGDKENARKQFEYVLEKAGEDPAYKQAEELLQKLK